VVDGGEVAEGAGFTVEELHDAHAGDVLLREGVDLGGGNALAAVAVADVVAEELGGVEDCGDDREREQCERPAHGEHDGDDEGESEHVFKDGEDAGGEHLVEGVDVGGDAGDEAADGVAVEEGDGHALDVAEDLAAEIEHDLLAGPLHEVGLNELEAKAEGERAEEEKAELGDALGGIGAKVAREPTGVGDAVEVGIDCDLGEVGAGDVRDGF